MREWKQQQVRMPDDLRERLEKHAEASFMPKNSFILQAVKEKLDRENAPEVVEEKEGAEV